MTISDIMDTRVMPSSRRYQAAAMTGPQDRRNVQRSGYVCPRGRRLPLPQLGAPDDPRGLTRLALAYLEALSVRGFTLETVRTYRSRLRLFLQWCGERGLTRVNEVTVGLFERYQRYLHQRRKPNGSAQGMGSQVQHLCAVQQFYRWLVRRHLVLSNPAADIELPKVPQQLPMKVLSAAEAERVLAQPRVETPLGLRDRALLELLYSTGMRRTELRGLNVTDVDFARGVVRVHAGKGNKDRVVPIGERALQWLQRYLDDVRPRYLFGQQQPALWLNSDGARLGGNHIGIMVRDCIEQAEVNKTGSCHLFRHTAATLMLENGADIRFIQAMLGHASLQTTQIYTQVSVSKLKEVHNATHPTTMQHGRAGARPSAALAEPNEPTK
jgi:integrase/recombinase XerD